VAGVLDDPSAPVLPCLDEEAPMKGGAQKPASGYIQPDITLLEPHIPGIEVTEVRWFFWVRELARANIIDSTAAQHKE
jgi:hypothetical protein